MAYEQLEELTSRKREKVALFLTAENMAGLLAIGLPAYIVTTGTSFWLRLLILSAAAVLGVALTSEIHGLAFYERTLWWLRGRIRRWIAGSNLRPAEFTAAPAMTGERALPLRSPVRRVAGSAQGALPPVLHVPAHRASEALHGSSVARSAAGDPPARNGHSVPAELVVMSVVDTTGPSQR